MIIKIDNSGHKIQDTLICICYRNFKANRIIHYTSLSTSVKTDNG